MSAIALAYSLFSPASQPSDNTEFKVHQHASCFVKVAGIKIFMLHRYAGNSSHSHIADTTLHPWPCPVPSVCLDLDAPCSPHQPFVDYLEASGRFDRRKQSQVSRPIHPSYAKNVPCAISIKNPQSQPDLQHRPPIFTIQTREHMCMNLQESST